MAIKVRNLGSGGASDALLKQLLEQYGEESKPKVGALGRIIAPLTGIGSIIDAYYDARYLDKNPKLLNVLKNYGQNVIQGFGTLATGKNYEPDLISQGISETLDKAMPGFKYSKLGQSTAARMAMDIAAGIITDPTTYFSFGATTLLDDVLRGGLKLAGLSDDIVEGAVKELSGSTLEQALKKVSSKYGDDVADALYVHATQTVGRGPLKSGALKLFGQTVTENPTAVLASKALVNPLSAVMDVAGAATKKFIPGVRSNFLSTFDPVQAAIEAGHGEEARKLLSIQRAVPGVPRKVLSELQDSEILESIGKLGEKERVGLDDLIEASREAYAQGDAATELFKKKGEVVDALDEFVNKITTPDVIYPEKGVKPAKALKNIGEESADNIGKFQKLFKELTPEAQQMLYDLSTRASAIGEDLLVDKSSIAKLVDDYLGTDIGPKGELLVLPKEASKNVKDFLSKYMSFESTKTKALQEAGLPTISPKEMGYLMRKPEAYEKKALKSFLKDAGLEGEYDKLLANKKVAKELSETGAVKVKTLRKAIDKDTLDAIKRYDPGFLGEEIMGGGATKERVFKTRAQAEKAGIRYGGDILPDIYEQTVRQNEQILVSKFVDDLVTNSDSFSKVPTGTLRTPVTIPGKGTFYTDKTMAKIAEDYIAKYTTQEGIEELLSSLDKIQRTWKKYVTGYGPNAVAYHWRNLLEDNIRVIVDGADVKHLPDDYLLAIDLFKFEDLSNKLGREEALKRVDNTRAAKFLKEVGVKTDDPLTELWNRVLDTGTWTGVSKSTSEMSLGVPKDIRKLVMSGEKIPTGKRASETYEDIVTVGGLLPRREQATRMATFFNNWRKEGAMAAGADAVNRVNFNYNELTKFERETLRKIIPFYGFVKNNLKFYLGTLQRNPEKISRYMNVYQGLQSGSQSQYREEWEAAPDYLKETLTIPLGLDEEGNLKYLTGLNLGIEELKGPESISENLSPTLSYLIERMTGKDLYRNEDILNVNQGLPYKNRSELLKKLLNYKEYEVKLDNGETYTKSTVAPLTRHALENLPFVSTLNTTGRRLSNLAVEGPTVKNLTDLLFPGRIEDTNVRDPEAIRQKKAEEALYELLRRKGIAEAYQRLYIPAGLKEQLLK
ncbi:MAG TPA: hypothetical protein PLT50_03160 [bacterium]|nr:hypothetical protein [bacterium]